MSILSYVQGRNSFELERILKTPTDQEALLREVEEILQKGETDYLKNSDYYLLLTALVNSNVKIDTYIGKILIYTGSGWSIGVDYSFGLTYEGIAHVLALLKINARVCASFEALRDFFSGLKCGDKKALITDWALALGQKQDGKHAISLFVHVDKGCVKVFINDCEGNAYNYDAISCMVSKDFACKVSESHVSRQRRVESGCYAIAIQDCKVFQENPSIVKELEELNPSTSQAGKINPMKTLPPSMHIANPRKEAIRVQQLMISHSLF